MMTEEQQRFIQTSREFIVNEVDEMYKQYWGKRAIPIDVIHQLCRDYQEYLISFMLGSMVEIENADEN